LQPGGLYLHHKIELRIRSTNASTAESRRRVALGPLHFPGGEVDHLAMSIANLEQHGFEVHDVKRGASIMRAYPALA